MAWSPEFCLSCDKFTNGYVFCSEECRIADLQNGQLDRGSSQTSLLTPLFSWPPRSGYRTPPSFRTVLPCQTLNKLRSNYNSASGHPSEPRSIAQGSEPLRSPGVTQAKEILKKYLQEKKSLLADGTPASGTSDSPDRSIQVSKNNKSLRLSRKRRSEKLRTASTMFHGVEPGSCGHCRELESGYNQYNGIGQQPAPAETKPIPIEKAYKSSRSKALRHTSLYEQISISPSRLSITNSLKSSTAAISFLDMPQKHIDRSMGRRSISMPSILPPLRLPPSFSPVDWEDIDMEGLQFTSLASEHMECGILCKVGNGSLCVAGNYWG